jgi:hypothetical protein
MTTLDWRTRGVRGVSALLGLYIAGGGCEVSQASISRSGAGTTGDAAPAYVSQEESRMWMTVGKRRRGIMFLARLSPPQ